MSVDRCLDCKKLLVYPGCLVCGSCVHGSCVCSNDKRKKFVREQNTFEHPLIEGLK